MFDIYNVVVQVLQYDSNTYPKSQPPLHQSLHSLTAFPETTIEAM